MNTGWLKKSVLLVAFLLCSDSLRADNFTMTLHDESERPAAKVLMDRAAKARIDISLFWYGHELNDWPEKATCAWKKTDSNGGGATTFPIVGSQAFRIYNTTWEGRLDAVRDNVVPHEVDHMVRHTVERKTFYRWEDEAAATMFETEAMHEWYRKSAKKQDPAILFRYFDSQSYPQSPTETWWVYCHGYVFSEYLLRLHDHQYFLQFLRANGTPSQRMQQFYGMTTQQAYANYVRYLRELPDDDCSCENIGCYMHGSHTVAKVEPTNGKAVLYVVGTRGFCWPCWRFWHDYNCNTNGLRDRINERFVVIPKCIEDAAFRSKYGVSQTPSFVVEDVGLVLQEYVNTSHLLSVLLSVKLPERIPPQEDGVPFGDNRGYRRKDNNEEFPHSLQDDFNKAVLGKNEHKERHEEQTPNGEPSEPSRFDRVKGAIKKGVEEHQAGAPIADAANKVVTEGIVAIISRRMAETVGFGLAGPVGLAAGAAVSWGLSFLWRRAKTKAVSKAQSVRTGHPDSAILGRLDAILRHVVPSNRGRSGEADATKKSDDHIAGYAPTTQATTTNDPPLPGRDVTEVNSLLGLRQLAGVDPLLDATFGLVARDEIERAILDAETPELKLLLSDMERRIRDRVNEIAPLKVK